MKEHIGKAVQSGLAGGILSCVVSGLLNLFILPFPSNVLSNAISHSIGGFISGFFSGLIGVLIFAYQHERQRKQDN
jgi:hypothetical protein